MSFERVPSRAGASGSPRLRLRSDTAEDHRRVDDAYSRFDLSGRDGYGAFLKAQYGCLAAVESALSRGGAGKVVSDWESRRRSSLLAADLRDLGIDAGPSSLIVLPQSAPALLGAIYVLEGSRFGGVVLSRRIPAGAPARFLGAPSSPASWRQLTMVLDTVLTDERAFADAVAAARDVFRLFERAARELLDGARV